MVGVELPRVRRPFLIALVCLAAWSAAPPHALAQGPAARRSAEASLEYLRRVMDEFHDRIPVYEDISSPGNRFHAWGKIPNASAAVTCLGGSTVMPHSGATAIRCEFTAASPTHFGGFYFLNGLLPSGVFAPLVDFGTVADACVDLTGATHLTFWVRGEHGGERLEFFMGGVGRNAETGAMLEPFPDSTPVIKHPLMTLTTEWERVSIPLAGRDISCIRGGFGWIANAPNNPAGAAFYVDDIQYELNEARRTQRLNQPRFLRSFTTLPLQPDPFDGNQDDDLDFVLRNTAFTYDNALALLAFLADGSADSIRRAQLIGDAMVYASRNDRTFNDGRLRSAYAAGDIALPRGWTPNGRAGTVPVPGFFDEPQQKFFEVEQSAVDVGNNAWAMIALLALYDRTHTGLYLDTARSLGTFIRTFRNDTGTYRGFQGGLMDPEAAMPVRRTFASVEHNLDVFAAYSRMFAATGEAQWQTDAQHARTFVDAMWDTSRNCYLAGTSDPSTRNHTAGQLPLDVQTWAVLALPDALAVRPGTLDCIEQHHRTSHDGFTGYDFNEDKDVVWFEGSAHAAVAYAVASQPRMVDDLRRMLRRSQHRPPFGDTRGHAAASHDRATSGFGFLLFRRLHVGATAWNVFAQLGFNPYYQHVAHVTAPARLHDFDADGQSDVIWRHSTSGAVAVWLLDGTAVRGGHSLATVEDPAWRIVGAGDLDGDGRSDVLWRHARTGAVAAWLMDGAAVRGGVVFATVSDLGWQPAGLGDANGDGRADVFWRHAVTGSVAVWLMNGAAVAAGAVIGVVGDPDWRIVAVGDLDGDGRWDLLWRHTTIGTVAVWFVDGLRLRDGQTIQTVADSRWQVAGVADINADGRADVLWRHGTTGAIAAWLMAGGTVVEGNSIATVADLGWQIVGLHDVDDDGNADVVWRHGVTGSVTVWLMDGTRVRGGFELGRVPDAGWKIISAP